MNSHARSTDPDTSHAAVPTNLTAQALKVLSSYYFSVEPLLDYDAYRMAGFGPNARDGQRCSDLRRTGMIERTGQKARTPSNKWGYLCVITRAGISYFRRVGLA
jgi:hypothetical protein